MKNEILSQNHLQPITELKGVDRDFLSPSGKMLQILSNINLTVREKELIAILGPSGCGKSTLLRILSGLIKPTRGEVFYRGQRLEGLNPGVAMVFQNFALYPWLTVYENIELGLEAKGEPKPLRQEKILQIISQVGLTGYEEAYPKELSGGMKQRVGIARALAVEPDLLCMDEPFSGLDVLTAENLRQEIINLWMDQEMPTHAVLLVTHNISEAIFLANRIVVLGRNPGQIRAIVDNTLPYPRDYRSYDFLALTDRIHDLITHVLIPDENLEATPRPEKKRLSVKLEPLPQVDASDIVVLLEAIHARGGEIDMFDFAEEMSQEFGKVVLTAKSAEMLNFVHTPRHLVALTPIGRSFVTGDHDEQQLLFRNQITQLRIFDLVLGLLEKADENLIDAEVIEEEFAIRLPIENPIDLFETLVNWGRYAGLLDFDARTNKLILEKDKSGESKEENVE